MQDDIDLGVLTPDEHGQYERFSHMNNMPIGFQLRAHAVTLAATAAWAILTVLFVTVGGPATLLGRTGSDPAAVVVIGLSVIVAGIVGICAIAVRVGTSALDRARTPFLEQIGYSTRLPAAAPSRDEDDDNYPVKSRRQLQHEWYGERSELNWTHRVQAEALGIEDADTYVNNFLESDRDYRD